MRKIELLLQNFMSNISHIQPWVIYLCFFISAILQITVPPYPGDTILILGGYLGSVGIKAGNIPILISYLLGTIVASYGLYLIGVNKGEAVLSLGFISKYFTKNHQIRAKSWLFKYGILIFFICKFIPGLNSLIIIFGGIFRYNPLWAYFGVGSACVVHNILFFIIGRSIGNNMDKIRGFLSTYNTIAIISLLILSILYLIYKKHIMKKRLIKEDTDT